MRVAPTVVLEQGQQKTLEQWARGRSLPVRLVERSRIVLLAAVARRRVIEKTTQTKPAHSTHWSTRTMAAETGISEASVRRIWRANGLKPHLVETFKISNDPQFAEKLEAIVGLYLSPPEHALVLCVDEKSQIQALDRTQPGLPLKRGRGATMTHDYKRNGTATLFCVAQHQQRRSDGTLHGAASPSGMAPLFAPHRSGHAGR